MRDAFARVLEQEMEQNERIVLITGDLGFGVLRSIHLRFPETHWIFVLPMLAKLSPAIVSRNCAELK